MVAGYPLEVSRVLGPRRITVIHKDGIYNHRFTIVFSVTVEPSKTWILPCFEHCFTRKKNKRFTHHQWGFNHQHQGVNHQTWRCDGIQFGIQRISVPKQLNSILLTFFWDVLRRHSSKIVLDIYSSIQSTCHMHAPCVMIASVWKRDRENVSARFALHYFLQVQTCVCVQILYKGSECLMRFTWFN